MKNVELRPEACKLPEAGMNCCCSSIRTGSVVGPDELPANIPVSTKNITNPVKTTTNLAKITPKTKTTTMVVLLVTRAAARIAASCRALHHQPGRLAAQWSQQRL